VRPTLGELAEDAMAYLLPSPMFEAHERDGYVFVAGRRTAWVVRVRRVDVAAVRAEAAERGAQRVEWWLGWSSPARAVEELLAVGLAPDEVPWLLGMTCTAEPPRADHVTVRPAALDEVAELERAVWGPDAEPPTATSPAVHHFGALLDGRLVGVGRAIDMPDAVALMGGVVLPEARRRGVYRALVHARWRHAAARGTPTLVVQAGALSAPVLDGLGFVRHGELRLFVDRL
jgi:GNAT superfamily N-acetyltransferase